MTEKAAPVFDLIRDAERRRFIQGFVEGAEWRDVRRMSTFRDIRTPASAYAEERFDTMTQPSTDSAMPERPCVR